MNRSARCSNSCARSAQFWDVATGKELRRHEMEVVAQASGTMSREGSIAFSPEGEMLASVGGIDPAVVKSRRLDQVTDDVLISEVQSMI